MRTALSLLLALVIAFGGVMIGSNAALHQEACDVTVTTTTLAGDPAAAAGIQVTSYAQYQDHLFWSATYPADNPQAIRTGYGFSQARWGETYQERSSSLDVSLREGGASSSMPIEDEVSASFLALLKEIQADRPNVTFSEQTVILSDYTDHFPLDVSYYVPYMPDYGLSNEMLIQRFEDYFFLPLPQSLSATVSLETDADGRLCGYNLYFHNTTYYLHSQSVYRGDTFYFALIPSGEQASLLDPSHIPGGWGLYAMTGTTEKDLTLSTVYSVPDGGRVVRFFAGPEGDDGFYLLTMERDMLYLTRLDSQSCQPTLHIPLFPWDDQQTIRSVLWEENCLVIFSKDGPFTVLVPDGQGGWQIDLEGDISRQNELACWLDYESYGTTSLLYDGTRLAVTAPNTYTREQTDFSLAVYDKEGLAYLGLYDSSLPGIVNSLYQAAPSHILSSAQTAS